MHTLWNIFVAVLLTVIELILSAIILFPGPIWNWTRRKVRALVARLPRPRWQPKREEVRSWQR
jgi:hypothetical protein